MDLRCKGEAGGPGTCYCRRGVRRRLPSCRIRYCRPRQIVTEPATVAAVAAQTPWQRRAAASAPNEAVTTETEDEAVTTEAEDEALTTKAEDRSATTASVTEATAAAETWAVEGAVELR